MGTNVEGEYLNVIAKTKLRSNLRTVFGNINKEIAGELVAPLELSNNLLEDSEKRSGCVVVDLGAETTTVIVFKNNIMRYLATIPLGMNNVNKDLATIQLEDAEAETVKLQYGDMENMNDDENQIYTSSDGRKIEVSLIKNIINARVTEIIQNVNNQIVKSNYSDKLLAGVILTGGGSNMKGIDKAFMSTLNVDKCRVARTVLQPIVKTSNASGFVQDSGRNNSILSLLFAGTIPCDGGEYDSTDLFDNQQREDDRVQRQIKQQEQAEAEKDAAVAFDEIKSSIRERIQKVKSSIEELQKNGRDKKVRLRADELSSTVLDILDDKYQQIYASLEGKDKFRQSLKEGSDLAELLRKTNESLTEAVRKAKDDNSFLGRMKNAINELVSE